MSTLDTKLIRVGHSPDPDDAFMFYALAKKAIPMRGFKVEHVIEDIESLNQRALKGELEVTAVSCHAYAYLADHYIVMRSGASVGDKYGPMLISKQPVGTRISDGNQIPDIRGKKIAIPGKLTTAYLVLQLYQPEFDPIFIPFDEIFDAVDAGVVDLGLVIHEGQITYEQRGYQRVLDLGEWWYQQTNLPLPLGVDIIRKDLGEEVIQSFSALFKESIEYALTHREKALEYALHYGRGISENIGDRFVGMYVNHYTVDLNSAGIKGLQRLLNSGFESGIIPNRIDVPFVDFPTQV